MDRISEHHQRSGVSRGVNLSLQRIHPVTDIISHSSAYVSRNHCHILSPDIVQNRQDGPSIILCLLGLWPDESDRGWKSSPWRDWAHIPELSRWGNVSLHWHRFLPQSNWADILWDRFFRQLRFQEFDLSELSLSSYVLTLNQEKPPFIALPVFPSRFFRHQSMYINSKSGISKPEDLKGKRIGIPEYQSQSLSRFNGRRENIY